MKTLYQRLYEAYQRDRGCRLSADDVDKLLSDGALAKSLSNVALTEAGHDDIEGDDVIIRNGLSWAEYKSLLTDCYANEGQSDTEGGEG